MNDNQTPINDTINLKLVNNSPFTQPVSILGGNQDPNANQPTATYQWNLALETFVGVNLVNIEVNGTPIFPVPTGVPLLQPTIQGVVDTLNTLGLGLFQYSGKIVYIASNTTFNRLYLY